MLTSHTKSQLCEFSEVIFLVEKDTFFYYEVEELYTKIITAVVIDIISLLKVLVS